MKEENIGYEYGIMGMGLLGVTSMKYGNRPVVITNMESWEWACWSIEYEIMGMDLLEY